MAPPFIPRGEDLGVVPANLFNTNIRTDYPVIHVSARQCPDISWAEQAPTFARLVALTLHTHLTPVQQVIPEENFYEHAAYVLKDQYVRVGFTIKSSEAAASIARRRIESVRC